MGGGGGGSGVGGWGGGGGGLGEGWLEKIAATAVVALDHRRNQQELSKPVKPLT